MPENFERSVELTEAEKEQKLKERLEKAAEQIQELIQDSSLGEEEKRAWDESLTRIKNGSTCWKDIIEHLGAKCGNFFQHLNHEETQEGLDESARLWEGMKKIIFEAGFLFIDRTGVQFHTMDYKSVAGPTMRSYVKKIIRPGVKIAADSSLPKELEGRVIERAIVETADKETAVQATKESAEKLKSLLAKAEARRQEALKNKQEAPEASEKAGQGFDSAQEAIDKVRETQKTEEAGKTEQSMKSVETEVVSGESELLAMANECYSYKRFLNVDDRKALRELIEKSILPIKFYAIKDITGTLAAFATPFTFEPSDDEGNWLIYQRPGEELALAVPVELNYIVGTIGKLGGMMSIMRRMFSGCKDIPDELHFARAERACRLRVIPEQPGKYQLVSRGVFLWAEQEPKKEVQIEKQRLREEAKEFLAEQDKVLEQLTQKIGALAESFDPNNIDIEALEEIADQIKVIKEQRDKWKKIIESL